MSAFFAVPQQNMNSMSVKDAYSYRVRGNAVVCVASPASGCAYNHIEDAISLDHNVLEVKADSGVTADGGPVSVPQVGREWTPATKERLRLLVMKAATSKISNVERLELSNLQALRRENIEGRTFEDVVRSAELDRRLENLKKALAEYVNYFPC